MRFTYLWPWWAVALGLAIVSGVTAYAYLRVNRPLTQGIRSLLISLRILAASILLLCLLEPVLVERRDITPRTNLLILADTSQSMQLRDVDVADQAVARLSLVNRLLFDGPDMASPARPPATHPGVMSNFMAALANRFDVHLYQFDTQPYQISNTINSLDAAGGLTDIATSIHDAAKEWRGQPIAGVVLLTDGAHNTSTSVVEKVTQMHLPIYAVGVGSPHPPKDLKISKVEVSPVVYMEHDVPILVTLNHIGYAGSKTRISLMGDDKVVDAMPITLTDELTQVVEFSLNPLEEGVFQYVVSVPVLEDELTSENNEETFHLKVVKTKLRVLYIDGRPRWEYTFLKRALERDPNIDSTCMILSSRSRGQLRDTLLARSDRYYPQTTDLSHIPHLPEIVRDLLFYNVLIIGDLRPSSLTPEQHSAIIDFVEKHGKAVIFLGGRDVLGRDGIQQTALADLLPIVIPPNGCFARDEDFSPELTQQGMYHPITRLADTQAQVEFIWRDLPPLSCWLGGFRLKGGATTLAEYRPHNSETGVPVIIFQRIGVGKSLLITAEGLWNWAFGVWNFKDEDNTYPRFWGQTIRWMATRANAKQIHVTTDLTTYPVGDEVNITAYAYDESYQPLDNADLKIEVTPPNEKRFQVRTEASSQTASVYTAQFRANQEGAYQIRAKGADRLSFLGEDSTEIFVQSPRAEFDNPQLNEALLKQLAAKTDGLYIPIDEAASLPKKIKEVRERVFSVQERDLWDSPIVLALMVGLLGTEWFLRKRRGLV